MLRFLRLPCALLALLLSALGGVRSAACEQSDDQRTTISPALVTAALPDAPTPVPGSPVALVLMGDGQVWLSAVLILPESISRAAPSLRRGSAGGARAP